MSAPTDEAFLARTRSECLQPANSVEKLDTAFANFQ
jgi:hypothetical protein